MYRLTTTISKTDGTPILPHLPEIQLNGGSLFQFRSAQPGFVGISKEVTAEGLAFIVVNDWESEQAYNDCWNLEESDPIQSIRKTNFDQFLAENGITLTRQFDTV